MTPLGSEVDCSSFLSGSASSCSVPMRGVEVRNGVIKMWGVCERVLRAGKSQRWITADGSERVPHRATEGHPVRSFCSYGRSRPGSRVRQTRASAALRAREAQPSKLNVEGSNPFARFGGISAESCENPGDCWGFSFPVRPRPRADSPRDAA